MDSRGKVVGCDIKAEFSSSLSLREERDRNSVDGLDYVQREETSMGSELVCARLLMGLSDAQPALKCQRQDVEFCSTLWFAKYMHACSCTHQHLLLSNEVRNEDYFQPQLDRSENEIQGLDQSPQHTMLGFRLEFTSPDMTIVIITKLSDIVVTAIEKQLGDYQKYTLLSRENE